MARLPQRASWRHSAGARCRGFEMGSARFRDERVSRRCGHMMSHSVHRMHTAKMLPNMVCLMLVACPFCQEARGPDPILARGAGRDGGQRSSALPVAPAAPPDPRRAGRDAERLRIRRALPRAGLGRLGPRQRGRRRCSQTGLWFVDDRTPSPSALL